MDSSRHHIRWFFHGSAMVTDYQRTFDALAWLVGCRSMSEGRTEDPAIGMWGGTTWIGDNALDLGEPIVAGGAVDRFVQRFGSHVSSFAVQVADLDATISHLESVGCRVASHIHEGIFTDPKTTAGLAIEWFDGHEATHPRFGGTIPPYSVPPLLEITQMAFVGAVVDDPLAAADRLAEVLDTSVTFRNPAAPPGEAQAGVSLPGMTLALFPVPERAVSEQLWGHVYQRAQTSSLGVRVADLTSALTALDAAGVRLARHDERMIVVHPEATGGVVLAIVDDLLPGDPRIT